MTIQFDFNDFTFISTFTIDPGAKGDYFTPDDGHEIKIKSIEVIGNDDPILWPGEDLVKELITDQEEL